MRRSLVYLRSCRAARWRAARWRTLRTLLPVATLVALPSRTHAQLEPGDTVRLVSRHLVLARGLFLGADSAYVRLRPSGAPDTSVAIADFERAEALRGREKPVARMAGRGALLGLGIGFGYSFLTATTNVHNREFGGRGADILLSSILGTLAGTAMGALIGSDPHEVWVGVVPRAPREPNSLDALHAERVAPLDTVRLEVRGKQVADGVLIAADEVLLVVVNRGRPDTAFVDRAAVSLAEVQRGRGRRGLSVVGKGAGIGAGVGGLGGAISGNPIIALLTAALGATAGTLISVPATMLPAPRWVRFDPRTMAPY